MQDLWARVCHRIIQAKDESTNLLETSSQGIVIMREMFHLKSDKQNEEAEAKLELKNKYGKETSQQEKQKYIMKPTIMFVNDMASKLISDNKVSINPVLRDSSILAINNRSCDEEVIPSLKERELQDLYLSYLDPKIFLRIDIDGESACRLQVAKQEDFMDQNPSSFW